MSENYFDGWPVKLVTHHQKGRHLVATRDIDVGEIVFESLAYVWIITETYKKKICSVCLKDIAELSQINNDVLPENTQMSSNIEEESMIQEKNRETETSVDDSSTTAEFSKCKTRPCFTLHCKDCYNVYFCSDKCMKIAHDVLHHNIVCEELKKLHLLKLNSHLKTYIAMTILIFQMSILEKQDLALQLTNLKLQSTTAGTFKDVDMLESHVDKWDEKTRNDWKKADLFVLAVVAKLKANTDSDRVFPLSFLRYFSMIESNCFGQFTDNDRCKIRVLHPKASYFNHSCDPNAETVHHGATLQIRSRYKIQEGEEVCLCYIDNNLPKSSRQEVLFRDYHFRCMCERCAATKKEKITYDKSIKKPKKRELKKPESLLQNPSNKIL